MCAVFSWFSPPLLNNWLYLNSILSQDSRVKCFYYYNFYSRVCLILLPWTYQYANMLTTICISITAVPNMFAYCLFKNKNNDLPNGCGTLWWQRWTRVAIQAVRCTWCNGKGWCFRSWRTTNWCFRFGFRAIRWKWFLANLLKAPKKSTINKAQRRMPQTVSRGSDTLNVGLWIDISVFRLIPLVRNID